MLRHPVNDVAPSEELKKELRTLGPHPDRPSPRPDLSNGPLGCPIPDPERCMRRILRKDRRERLRRIGRHLHPRRPLRRRPTHRKQGEPGIGFGAVNHGSRFFAKLTTRSACSDDTEPAQNHSRMESRPMEIAATSLPAGVHDMGPGPAFPDLRPTADAAAMSATTSQPALPILPTSDLQGAVSRSMAMAPDEAGQGRPMPGQSARGGTLKPYGVTMLPRQDGKRG